MNMSYATLTGDLSGANYSSMRAGSLEEREGYKKVQNHQIGNLVLPIFNAWLEVALLNGAIGLPFRKLEQFNKPKFSGRRWPWVDPGKDIQAALDSINGRLTTRTKWTEENGEDLEEIIDTLKYEEALFAKAGLELPEINKPVPGKPEDVTPAE